MFKIKDDLGSKAHYVDDDYGPIFGGTEIALMLDCYRHTNERSSHFVYGNGQFYPGAKGNMLCGGEEFDEGVNIYNFKTKNIQTSKIHLS